MVHDSRRQFGWNFDCFDSCLQIVYTILCFCVALFDAFQSSGKLGYYRPMPLLFGVNDLFYSLRQIRIGRLIMLLPISSVLIVFTIVSLKSSYIS